MVAKEGELRGFLLAAILVAAVISLGSIAEAQRAPSSVSGRAAAAAAGSAAALGRWSRPFEVGVRGIHSAVLPNGKVLLFSYPLRALGSDAVVWDPRSGSTRNVSLAWPQDIFCSGLSFLPDGRLFITGGHVHEAAFGLGIRNTTLFDPANGAFPAGPLLSEERWYPTNVELGNGHVLVFGGDKDKRRPATTVDDYDPFTNSIAQLPPSASKQLNSYPKLHLLPNGKIAFTNQARAQLFDPAKNAWTVSAPTLYGGRGESDQSVLLPGLTKILEFGGANQATGVTNTAEIIDFSSPTPRWRYTAPMHDRRVWANPVMLPDGRLLVVGGGQGGAYLNPVRQAELFDPVSETWTVMASQRAPRIYHSTAVLLPDGRVLSAGQDNGRYQSTGEIYSPPYLFKGPRPQITSAPRTIGYGQAFTVSTPDAGTIARVALLRPAAVTHSMDSDQRYVDLAFTAGADGRSLALTSPPDGNHAPPGWYMLFLVSSAGVPSVASWIHVTAPPPVVTSISPASGSVGTVVDIRGSGLSGASSVAFDHVLALSYTIVSDGEISAVVPSGATSGPLTVSTPGGAASSAQAFTVISIPPPPYRDAVLADGPVAYWRLAETSGGALDETGHVAPATYLGAVARGIPGALATDANAAVGFNGVDASVSVPADPALDVGDTFTYELWIRRSATQGVTQRLIHKGAGPASLGLGPNNKIVLVAGGPGASAVATSSVAITDQSWHQVVATKDGPTTHIYLDGADVTVPLVNGTFSNNTSPLSIGRAVTGGAFFSGAIDEVAIYAKALTPEQVLLHYRAGKGLSS